MPFRRAPGALVALLAGALAPAAAQAQPLDARVLPRGLLEVGAGARYSHWDSRFGGGDPSLGAELLPAYRSIVDRVLAEPVGTARAGLATVLGSLPGGDPALAEAVTGGSPALGVATDVRILPLTVRYGLTSRVTLFASIPLERRGTSVTSLYLAGANLGLNPAADSNAAALARIDPAFAGFGGGALLPVAGSPAARELQARLREASPADTLRLPAAPVRLADLPGFEASLSAEEEAALALRGSRRPFAFGDLQAGAQLLLLPGPAGWPYPEDGARGMRAVLGVRGRLPTGRSGALSLTELPAGGGHAGVGAEIMADLFPARRWSLHGGASLDHRFPADVTTVAFGSDRPFPADTALRTARRAPGAELEAALAARWRLTDEIAFEGTYALHARGRTELRGEEGLLASPLGWRSGGSAHGVGAGVRYSTLQGLSRGTAALPYEVTLGITTAVAGAGDAPDATTISLTGRVIVDPRGAAALLPGRGDPPPPPPPPPGADTLPPPPADPLPPPR